MFFCNDCPIAVLTAGVAAGARRSVDEDSQSKAILRCYEGLHSHIGALLARLSFLCGRQCLCMFMIDGVVSVFAWFFHVFLCHKFTCNEFMSGNLHVICLCSSSHWRNRGCQ